MIELHKITKNPTKIVRITQNEKKGNERKGMNLWVPPQTPRWQVTACPKSSPNSLPKKFTKGLERKGKERKRKERKGKERKRKERKRKERKAKERKRREEK